MLDAIDVKILACLESEGALTNAALAERVGLSASQASRRKAGLEEAGYIRGYRADLDLRRLGYLVEAFTRVTLSAHKETTHEDFAAFLSGLREVQHAWSITGDADYLIHIRVKSLDDLADFIHRRLLPHAQVAQVRSDIVLKPIKR